MTPFAIEADGLVKTYGLGRKAIRAVDGLALRVPEGSIYGLLGRNSSGKTTTIRMAMGLARPTAGTMRVFGMDPARDPERVKVLAQVGYVPEDKALGACHAVCVAGRTGGVRAGAGEPGSGGGGLGADVAA